MQDIRAAWKVRVKDALPNSADILLYCLLRAIRSKSNDKRTVLIGLLHKCFSPITNPRKLAAGNHPWAGLHQAMYRLAAHDAINPLMECLETGSEQALYRTLLHDLLTNKIRPTDRRIVCFIVRTDFDRPEDQMASIITAGIGLASRAAGRGRIGKRKAAKERAVQRIVPPPPRVNLTGVRLFLLAARDVPDLLMKADVLRSRHAIVGTSGDSVAYTMPIRASVLQRRNMLEGFQRLRLGPSIIVEETVMVVGNQALAGR